MRKNIVLKTVVLLAGIVILLPAQTWTIEQVTDNTESDKYPFVTRVSSGLMVVYDHNDGDGEIFVASNSSGSWVTSRVTDNSCEEIGLDITSMPASDDVHIAHWWIDTPDEEISYTSGNTSGWNTERVTDNADEDEYPSIEVDKNGFVHMVFQRMTGGDYEIFYANNVTGSWISEQVTDNATNDESPWLALDTDGNPHIVYTNSMDLIYTTKTAGIWTSPDVIVGGCGINSYPYLVTDADDYVHVIYSKNDGADEEIYYANNVTGSWQEAKVTSNDYDDACPILFIDPAKKAHIAYMTIEPTDAEMFYANNTAGVWDFSRITDNSVHDNVLLGCYFITDALGYGNIFFWNVSDGDDEIYVARSNTPIIAGIEETHPVCEPISINVERGLPSSATTINFTIPKAGFVTLKVYDASGSLVNTLVDGKKREGEHRITWDGTRINAGIYFLHITSGRLTDCQKIIVR